MLPNDQTRYAIYLAPAPSTPLWRYASALLGYDAATGETVSHPPIVGISEAEWREATHDPRKYGFHATIKAPFRLAPGHSAERLGHALQNFAASIQSFPMPLLQVEAVDIRDERGFLALTPAAPNAALQALEAAIVPLFDPFRAALSEAEIAKRDPSRLSDRQKDYLMRFGYPHVLEEFQPHFSLTGRTDAVRDKQQKVAEAIFNQLGPVSLNVDAIVLFEQLRPDQAFRIAARYAFGSSS